MLRADAPPLAVLGTPPPGVCTQSQKHNRAGPALALLGTPPPGVCAQTRKHNRARPAQPRGGFTLAELIVVLTLMSLLGALLFGALTVQLRLARVTAQRALDADAVRTATTVLGGELRRSTFADVRAIAADSIALRAFRGMGVICGAAGSGGGSTVVYYRGDRAPDPAKDSAVWIGSAGAQNVVAVTSVSPSTSVCVGAGPGAAQTWHTDPQVAGPGVLLLFESGSYYLTARALRYRLGAAGRQPLTAELFAQTSTGFGSPNPGMVQYSLALASAPSVPIRSAIYFTLPKDSL